MGKKSRTKRAQKPQKTQLQPQAAAKTVITETALGQKLSASKPVANFTSSFDDTSFVRTDITRTLIIFGVLALAVAILEVINVRTDILQTAGGAIVDFLNL